MQAIEEVKERTLHLTLKKKWFDMIASGEKKEEYREIKPYWIERLVGPGEQLQFFSTVQFYHGYKSDRPTMKFEIQDGTIVMRTGKYEWGAIPGKKYFVIKLGSKL